MIDLVERGVINSLTNSIMSVIVVVLVMKLNRVLLTLEVQIQPFHLILLLLLMLRVFLQCAHLVHRLYRLLTYFRVSLVLLLIYLLTVELLLVLLLIRRIASRSTVLVDGWEQP